MEEVIVKRPANMLASYIVLIVFGAICSLFGAIALIAAPNKLLGLFLAFGLIFLGVGIAGTVVLARTPKAYVTYKDGKLFLSKGGAVCSPSEVDYCRSQSYWFYGVLFDYGKLIISVGGKEYCFRYVKNVTKAANIINNLKAQYTAIENAQKEIAARNAAENKDTTEN
ncbi:MAG: hypothetical protein K2G96_02285 [Clostridia bacterium]|nr:hypothetical protein [Clostridia bacterium]